MDFRASFLSSEFFENRKLLFTVFFLALSAVALTGWLGISYLIGKEKQRDLQQAAVQSTLTNLQQHATDRFSGNVLALSILARSPALKAFAEDPSHTPMVVELTQALLALNKEFHQIRYIDAEGYEKLRFDTKGGTLSRIEPENLQFKGERRYFVEAIGLEPLQTYISDIDLNREYGKVEVPWRPTVRIAVPTAGASETLQGVLVANINPASLLADFTAARWPETQSLQLLNPEGYWISGKPEDQLWGFMFGNTATLAQQQPHLWAQFNGKSNSVFQHGNITYTVLAVTVGDLVSVAVPLAHPEKILFYVLHQNRKAAPVPAYAFIPALAIVLTIIIFSWLWAKNVVARRRTEQELVKSEKLSSLGSLVAGVAHELNTPLGCAVTTASTVEAKARNLKASIQSGQINKSQLVEFIDDMGEAGGVMLQGLSRANELISNFKHVAVDQSGEQKRRFQLDDYISETASTFMHLFKSRKVYLKLTLETDAELYSYPGGLSQVIINLVQNSLLHGYTEDEEGVVEIATKWANQNSVTICVTDNGCGIPQKSIGRIFDPFFTTRMGQGGSGLGLNIVYNIVTDQLGGNIKVISDPELHFTQFTITIPCELRDIQQQENNKKRSA